MYCFTLSMVQNVLQLSSQLQLLETNSLEHSVTLLTKSPHEVSEVDIGGKKLDLLVAEPYFISTLLPWHNLYFWYVRTALNALLSPEVVVMPCKAFLKGIPGSVTIHQIGACGWMNVYTRINFFYS